MKKSEKYNASGYLDLTAYHALNKIECEEESVRRERRRKKKRRKNGKKS